MREALGGRPAAVLVGLTVSALDDAEETSINLEEMLISQHEQAIQPDTYSNRLCTK